MLQQTRVEAVSTYFNRWMERFPDIQALADAEEEEVLRLWAGLGYYSRARRLHETVREVLARYDGAIPEDPDELERLPGIGPYTAGAIASIAFGASVPAVDGNVRRVLARISDVGSPTAETQRLWAGELVDPGDPGSFNQAFMELGSLVCTPRNPRCTDCPVSTFCASRVAGTQHLRPTPPMRRRPPLIHEAVAILLRTEEGEVRVLLRRRPLNGLLGRMWEFPGMEFESPDDEPGGAANRGAVVSRTLALQVLTDMRDSTTANSQLEGEGVPLGALDHAFSHRRVQYSPFLFRCRTVATEERASPREDLRWVTQDESDDLPLPAAQRTLASRVWSL
jgi:A/G-specific adenine glycosylase